MMTVRTGTVTELRAEVDDEISIGAVLAVIDPDASGSGPTSATGGGEGDADGLVVGGPVRTGEAATHFEWRRPRDLHGVAERLHGGRQVGYEVAHVIDVVEGRRGERLEFRVHVRSCICGGWR